MSNVSKASSASKIGEFWDRHDFIDYDNPNAADVDFTVTCCVPVDEEPYAMLEQEARRRGVKVETLVDVWLRERLSRETKRAE